MRLGRVMLDSRAPRLRWASAYDRETGAWLGSSGASLRARGAAVAFAKRESGPLVEDGQLDRAVAPRPLGKALRAFERLPRPERANSQRELVLHGQIEGLAEALGAPSVVVHALLG